ncbi:MAG: thioredoxin family protein [Nitrososphaerales archaeon]
MPRVLEASGNNFDRILKSTRKVFVDFWAPWCKPCIRMNPVIDKLAERHLSIVFAKVNVDQESDIASRFHISSLPAYVLFKDAHPSASKIGAISELELEKLISE